MHVTPSPVNTRCDKPSRILTKTIINYDAFRVPLLESNFSVRCSVYSDVLQNADSNVDTAGYDSYMFMARVDIQS